jgi:hypothetical protein
VVGKIATVSDGNAFLHSHAIPLFLIKQAQGRVFDELGCIGAVMMRPLREFGLLARE